MTKQNNRIAYWILVFVIALCSTNANAQTYNELWKQYEEAGNKDLPRTQIGVLDKIVVKAEAAKDYGQLLSAGLRRAGLQVEISPDSLEIEVASLENRLARYDATNPTLAAVCRALLGKIYTANGELGENHRQKGREYFDKALANPSLLAAVQYADYKPLVAKGYDSSIFGNDLLHVIGMEAGRYDLLHDYYDRTGNRAAACLTALKLLQNKKDEMRNKDYLASLDSLLALYDGLDEAGEVAIERFMSMDGDVTEEYHYGEQILKKYAGWQRITRVSNSMEYMKAPRFEVRYGDNRFLPYRQRVVKVETVRNVSSLTLTAWRLKANGEDELHLWNDKEIDKVKKLIEGAPVQVKTREYNGIDPWVSQTDSIVLDGMRPGVYLFEVKADAPGLEPKYQIGYVSDVFVMWEEQPQKVIRFSVVSSTTGQPLPKAWIKLTTGDYWDKNPETKLLHTDGKGEVLFTYEKRTPSSVFAYTDDDRASLSSQFSSDYSYSDPSNGSKYMRVYTDRSIYRPGQTVHVAIVSFERYNREQFRVRPDDKVVVRLYDANSQQVDEQTATTDEFGSASADFTLPSSGLTGGFSVRASGATTGSTSFRVEEYKRPTFQLSFDDYKEKYANGDTVVVKGYAKTYAGVPVQGAKVAYTVKRRQALWCWWASRDKGDETLLSDTTETDADGVFYMRMPMVLPKAAELFAEGENNSNWLRGVFYNFQASATVTDQGGESHSGSTSLPLGTKTTALYASLSSRYQRDSLRTVTYRYVNAAGEPIDGMVRLTIDGKDFRNGKSFPANKPIDLDPLSSGQHTFVATCGDNKVTSKVVLFSMDDKRTVIETHDWFYTTGGTFRTDGTPVYVQFGSSDDKQHVVYSLFSGNKVIESGTTDQSNALTTRTFKYKEEYGDGVTFTCAWVRDGQLYRHNTTIVKPEPDKRLTMKWKTFRDRLIPGQKEEWSLTVVNKDGKAADARLLCTMFDKSLDQLKSHGWSLSTYIYRSTASAYWYGFSTDQLSSSMTARTSDKYVSGLSYARLNENHFRGLLHRSRMIIGYGRPVRMRGKASAEAGGEVDMLMAAPMIVEEEAVMANSKVASLDVKEKKIEKKVAADETPEPEVQMRENLDETAFFYPHLRTDANGEVTISFTLPESLTTWRFMGLAYDKEVNHGQLSGEAIAQKTVMVSPNVPRFVREGDQATIGARLMNTSENQVTGTACLELVDPMTDKVVYTTEQPFTIAANGTSSATMAIGKEALEGRSLLIARIIARGDGYSDGEQHYLPVLSNREQVLNTVPVTQHNPGIKTIDIARLFPKGTTNQKLTVEYTNHPSWLMIQALPYVGDVNEHNAISLVSAYYANSLGQSIMKASPKIKQTIDAWVMEERNTSGEAKDQDGRTSLTSALEKNQSLKDLVLNETPWVLDAQAETQQKHDLVRFFDENLMGQRISNALSHLKKLQNSDGSWSWWEGMRGSIFMTTTVSMTLVRLNTMIGEQEETKGMLKNAFKFMSKEIAKEVVELKKLQKKGFKDVRPSEIAVDYLYLCALDGRELSSSAKSDIAYLVGLLSKKTSELTIYGKAVSAVILAHNNYKKKAAEYLQSMKEYSVYTEEMGRYYDTRKAYYSWFDYRIPTEVAAIEALRQVSPNDKQTVEEMQRWLLQEKRTQAWDTPVNSVNAVYAFFGDEGIQKMAGNIGQADIRADGQPMTMSQATAGLGVVRGEISGSDIPSTLTFEKTDEDTSWGGVYAKFLQPVTEIDDHSAGITVTREIIPLAPNTSPLKVGDRVKVRITIRADRDYDFVQVVDRRAACMEPVGQLSGYHWGYYCAPKDCSTNYYFDQMAKGKHVVETEYYIDREGDYLSGSCTVQCAYAPEFYGRAKGSILNVKR